MYHTCKGREDAPCCCQTLESRLRKQQCRFADLAQKPHATFAVLLWQRRSSGARTV